MNRFFQTFIQIKETFTQFTQNPVLKFSDLHTLTYIKVARIVNLKLTFTG